MAPPKKSRPEDSDGEEFSDVDSNVDSSSDDLEIGEDTLTWVCPTVGPQAKRNEYEVVS